MSGAQAMVSVGDTVVPPPGRVLDTPTVAESTRWLEEELVHPCVSLDRSLSRALPPGGRRTRDWPTNRQHALTREGRYRLVSAVG